MKTKKPDHHEYEGLLNSDFFWKRVLGFTLYFTLAYALFYIAWLVLIFISSFVLGASGLI